MCGIAGSIGPALPDPRRIERTLALMRNRGPDARGVHCERLGPWQVALLFTRLAIVDLDPRANQPFAADDLVLVFNGEIYNHREVRAELERAGQAFRTASDTEVLLQAWRHWGAAAFDRLEGMWAFALLDRRARRLVLSRDRFGEKPLHLWRHGGTLYFGSEVKYLAALAGARPAVDLDQLRRYLVYGYRFIRKKAPGWYADVTELPAATWTTVAGTDIEGSAIEGSAIDGAAADGPAAAVPRPYWRLAYAPRPMTAAAALEAVRERLVAAVRLRLRADVPIAFCLSGGIDSSTLAGLAAKTLGQRLDTFSIIDGDARYDESDRIDRTQAFLGCANHRVRTATHGFFARLAAQTAYHDGPVATISYYLHAFLAEAIAERGYRVAISGTAADELFAGYYDHYGYWLAEMHGEPDFPQLLEDWRGSYGAAVRNPVLRDPLAFVRNPAERGHLTLDAATFRDLLTEPFEEPFEEVAYTGSLLRNRMLNELFHDSTPIILREDDLNAMQYSVENRSPFLDRRLAEFLFTVPTRHLIRDGYPKWLLRAAGAGVVDDAVRLEKRKFGFNAAIDSLVDRGDPETRARLLDASPIFDLVRRDALERFIAGSMTENSFSKFLYSFIAAKLFLEHCAAWTP